MPGIIARQHDTAMVVDHLLVLIHVGNLIVRTEFDQFASRVVARRDVNAIVVHNRRGNDRDPAGKHGPPQQSAVFRRYANQVLRR